MSGCTARKTGRHRTASGAARCPVHGRGSMASSLSIRSSSPPLPPVRPAARRPSRPAPLPANTASRRPAPAEPSRGRRPAAERAQQVERALIQAGLNAATSKAFTGPLIDVSTALTKKASRRWRFGHWLCLLLADAADTIDVDTVAGVAGDIFADALIRVGVPGWAASVIGWGVSNAAQKALVHVMPGAQLCLGLRVLSVLVCP